MKALIHHVWRSSALATLMAVTILSPSLRAVPRADPSDARRAPAGASLRPSFHANLGQFPAAVRYAAPVGGGRVYLTDEGAVAIVGSAERSRPVRWHLAGGARREPVAEVRLAGVAHYLIGDRSRWKSHVPTFDRVRYSSVLPGVDMVYYGQPGALEFDLEVAPGVDAGAIALTIDGTESVRVNPDDGSLTLEWAGGSMRWQAPIAYQSDGTARQPVAASYRLANGHTVGFDIGRYDHARPLVIDPVLLSSTFVGGTGADAANDLVVGADGTSYVVGATQSTDFPVTPGAFDSSFAAGSEAFVARLAADGSSLEFATFLGGSGNEAALGVALDTLGNVYVTGWTTSADFPSVNGYQPAYIATQCVVIFTLTTPCRDTFVTKLSPGGDAVVYSTYFGGSHHDDGVAIDVNAGGDAFVLGLTYSDDLPLLNAVDSVYVPSGCGAEGLPAPCPDPFVMRLSSSGSMLQYSTYLGGDFNEGAGDLIVDAADRAIVIGSTNSDNFPVAAALQPARAPGSCGVTPAAFYCFDIFLTRIAPFGGALDFSTYFGGSGDDRGTGVVLDEDQTIWMTGHTTSIDFPLAAPLQPALAAPSPSDSQCSPMGGSTIIRCPDALITRFNTNATAVLMSTYLGGVRRDEGRAIARDASGRIAIAGLTQSFDFPVVDAWQRDLVFGTCPFPVWLCPDGFVTVLKPAAAGVAYSTYLGSFDTDTPEALAASPDGSLVVAGTTGASFGTTPGSARTTGSGTEGFVARFAPPPATGILVTLAGTGQPGAPPSTPTQALRTPFGALMDIAVQNQATRYVVDATNHRVLVIDSSNSVNVLAGNGTAGSGGDGGPAVSAQLNSPSGIALDAAGNAYIADSGNNRIRMVTASGMILTIAGTGAAGYSGDGGPGYLAQLNYPIGLVVHANAVIFSDTGNSRVRMITSDGTIITIAGNGTPGSSGDDGPSTLASLALPTGLAVDSAGRLLIADFGAHNVRRVDPSGTISTLAGTGAAGSAGDGGPANVAQLNGPYGIDAFAGYVLVTELLGHRARVITPDERIATVAGTGEPGGIQVPPRSAFESPLSFPSGVAFDGVGNILLADIGNYRVALARFVGP